jgi:hypothetical protein
MEGPYMRDQFKVSSVMKASRVRKWVNYDTIYCFLNHLRVNRVLVDLFYVVLLIFYLCDRLSVFC